jgi:hypothetical protein
MKRTAGLAGLTDLNHQYLMRMSLFAAEALNSSYYHLLRVMAFWVPLVLGETLGVLDEDITRPDVRSRLALTLPIASVLMQVAAPRIASFCLCLDNDPQGACLSAQR